jgi:hypothetical protein
MHCGHSRVGYCKPRVLQLSGELFLERRVAPLVLVPSSPTPTHSTADVAMGGDGPVTLKAGKEGHTIFQRALGSAIEGGITGAAAQAVNVITLINVASDGDERPNGQRR